MNNLGHDSSVLFDDTPRADDRARPKAGLDLDDRVG